MKRTEVVQLPSAEYIPAERRLRIRHPFLAEHARALAASPLLPGLDHLEVMPQTIDGEALKHLAGIVTAPALRAITFRLGTLDAPGARLLGQSPLLAPVSHLSFTSTRLASAALCALAKGPSLDGTTHFSLIGGGCRLGNTAARALAASPCFSGVLSLELRYFQLNIDILAALLPDYAFPQMSALCLDRMQLGDEAALFLANHGWLDRLETLNIQGNYLGRAGRAALLEHPRPHLRHLTIRQHQDPDGLLMQVLQSPLLPQLESYPLTRDSFKLPGWRAIAHAEHLPVRLRTSMLMEVSPTWLMTLAQERGWTEEDGLSLHALATRAASDASEPE